MSLRRPSAARRRISLLIAFVLSATAIAGLAQSPAQADPPLTIVSLTFDDGNANQMAAASILQTYTD